MTVKLKRSRNGARARLQRRTASMNEQLIISAMRQHEQTETAEGVSGRLRTEIVGHKKVKEALERLVAGRTAELRESNEQLGMVIHSIAHDLRAPLRAMQSFGQVLARDYARRLDEKGRDLAIRISEAGVRMDKLLHDLLAFAQVAQTTIELAPVNLQIAVQSALFNCRERIQEANGEVKVISPMPKVLAHGPTLEVVIANLVGNALKFVAPGVLPRVIIRADETGKMVCLSIQDNGIGIAPQYQERIFQTFRQLQAGEYKGTGIGLTIVQKGVDRMKGRIGVESKLGEGSRFWIELPKA